MRLLPFEYAARNAARHPLRAFLTASASAAVVFLVVLMGSFVHSLGESMKQTGHPLNLIILGTAKAGIPGAVPYLSNFYVGLGLGAHFLDVKIDPTSKAGGKDAVEDAVQKVAGESTEVGWHGVLGFKFSLPAFPLSAFAEVRYQDIFESKMPDMNSAYIGLNLKLN